MRDRIMLESSTISSRMACSGEPDPEFRELAGRGGQHHPGAEPLHIGLHHIQAHPRPACSVSAGAVEKPGLKMWAMIWRSLKLSSCWAVYQPSASSRWRTRATDRPQPSSHGQRPLGFAAHQLHLHLACSVACPWPGARGRFDAVHHGVADQLDSDLAHQVAGVRFQIALAAMRTTACTCLPVSAAASRSNRSRASLMGSTGSAPAAAAAGCRSGRAARKSC